ncbi:guanylate cyclase [Leptospira perolatii]|uniref:Guanylate cyclase n=1 Tax=Leptospira perolatii TaxID=2023191 RepID=A0A2M9ZN02_9LEPT|nr:peroxidase family protein [Leptospira perolatii]PJZ68934.1 guanylate cyclase [Leptospira perolatii]PJZ73448.1 guanylate cyclase [Leptospira perolatii]
MIHITFENDLELNLSPDLPPKSLLQISLEHNIPHVHACGGNARCSTCRVLVLEGLSHLSPRNEQESLLAKRKGFPEEVRLACQSKVLGDVNVRRLVIDDSDLALAGTFSQEISGNEKSVAILFSDIRRFTSFSESHLPYDVIHILNRYFFQMGEKVLKYEGAIDKYIGDGLMAIFGLQDDDSLKANLAAIQCGLEMQEELRSVNHYLKKHFHTDFEIGIGINYGNAILGQLGHPLKMSFTAIGDSVNSASRIESTTKKAGSSLLVSQTVFDIAKNCIRKGRTFETKLKGKQGNHRLYEILGLADGVLPENMEFARFKIWDLIDLQETGTWLQLGAHAASIFSPENEWLGLDASIRFPSIANEERNKRLKPKLEKLVELWEKCFSGKKAEASSPSSLSDLIAYSACIAVEKAGGPKIPISFGRKDSQVENRRMILPNDTTNLEEILDYYSKLGFDLRETVALLGSHTLGWHKNGSFTETPYIFNNDYYKDLLKDGGKKMLDADRALLSSEDSRRIVLEYALNEQKFLNDFKAVFAKFLQGQKE